MNAFTTLFGISPSSIRKTCVLTPFLTKEILAGFQIEKPSKGALYSVGDNGLFSLIHTGMGSTFLGDAVLYLADTPCENLILFGSCGAVRKSLGIGDIVTVKKAVSQDSFVDMLLKRKPKDTFYPDKSLLTKLSGPRKVNCLTVGSLKLEEQYVKEGSIDIVDMETAPFFAAAKFTQKKAAAILFVTDILKSHPYYIKNKPLLKNLTSKASRTVYELVENRGRGLSNNCHCEEGAERLTKQSRRIVRDSSLRSE